jgi:DNA-directed RNA polymerase subunit RPC12/RpoP
MDPMTKNSYTTLWYLCTECSSALSVRWHLDKPQQREQRLTCDNCGRETDHQLAGLRPTRRHEGCPEWCADHVSKGGGIEKHRRIMIFEQGHLNGRWAHNSFEIVQYEEAPLVPAWEVVPHLTGIFPGALATSRVAHALLGQALTLMDESDLS